jgi:hypothetical protein
MSEVTAAEFGIRIAEFLIRYIVGFFVIVCVGRYLAPRLKDVTIVGWVKRKLQPKEVMSNEKESE